MKKYAKTLAAAFCMLLMILLGPEVTAGAKEGVALCLRAVIPALFPFFVVSAYLNGQLSEKSIPALRPIEILCGMPENTGSVFLLGILGGYPVGAQSIAQRHESKMLHTRDAERMLGFCNNPGPAFIFGMLSAFFPEQKFLWYLWLIQILSALLTGSILPRWQSTSCPQKDRATPVTLPLALERAIRSILSVCGWVILFRMFLSLFTGFCGQDTVFLFGIVELTNGCLLLNQISALEDRFIAASGLLSFGGLCVHMQTLSSVPGLRLHYYIAGKFTQTLLSVALAALTMGFLHA